MTQLKIFQIGVSGFGRYGFEELVELSNYFDEVDVELKGVCDRDFDGLEDAEKFAERNDLDLETFVDVKEMYEEASNFENVLIYDSGSASSHAQHVYDSLGKGFFHLARQPPSMTRKEHMKEREMAREKPVFWKTDFIERQNPVVMKAEELLEGARIDRIRVFRQSSAGIQKLLSPHAYDSVEGGDILDKMINDVYVLDFLEVADQLEEMEVVDASVDYVMPFRRNSDDFMTVDSGKTGEIDEDVATAQTRAVIDAGARIELHSSWLGVTDEAAEAAPNLADNLIDESFSKEDGTPFLKQECAFFVVEGSRNLVGDLLHKKLYDPDSGGEIGVPSLMHGQLYRVLRNTLLEIREGGGKEGDMPDRFVETLFDVKEECLEEIDGRMQELEKSRKQFKSMTVTHSGKS